MGAIYREAKVYFDQWEVKSWANIQLNFGIGSASNAIIHFPHDDSIFNLPLLTRVNIVFLDRSGNQYLIFSGFPESVQSTGSTAVLRCEEAFSFLKNFSILSFDPSNPTIIPLTGFFLAGTNKFVKIIMPVWELTPLVNYFQKIKSSGIPENSDGYEAMIVEFRENLIDFMRRNMGGKMDQSNKVADKLEIENLSKQLESDEQYMASFIRANLLETLFLPLVSDFDFNLMITFLLAETENLMKNLQSIKRYNSILELLQNILAYLHIIPGSIPIRQIPENSNTSKNEKTFKESHSISGNGFYYFSRIHLPRSGFLNCPPAVIRNLDKFSYYFSQVHMAVPSRTFFLTSVLGHLFPIFGKKYPGKTKKHVKTNKGKPVKNYRMFAMAPIELMFKIKDYIDEMEPYHIDSKNNQKYYNIKLQDFFTSKRIYSEKEVFNGIRPSLETISKGLELAIAKYMYKSDKLDLAQELYLSTLVESTIATRGGYTITIQGVIDSDIVPGIPVLFIGENYSIYGIPMNLMYNITPFGDFSMTTQLVTSGIRPGMMTTDKLLDALYDIYYKYSPIDLKTFMEKYVSLIPWVPPTLSKGKELQGFLPPRFTVESYKAILSVLNINLPDLVKEEKVFNKEKLDKNKDIQQKKKDEEAKKEIIKKLFKNQLLREAVNPEQALGNFVPYDQASKFFQDTSKWPTEELASKRRLKIKTIVEQLNKLSKKIVKL